MVKITGRERHSRRLAAMRNPEARAKIYRALFWGGQQIQVEAQTSITAGSISGKGHIPSRPGEPPNADTRALDTQIETTGDPGRLRVQVTSNAPHAADMEFGNSKVEARPYMAPAAQKKRRAVADRIVQAINSAIKGA
jgi:hypothetical protein